MAVMAVRSNLHCLADHRRDAESVGRAAGVSLRAVGEPDDERHWRSRKGIGEVDPTCAHPDQVLVIESNESIMRIGSNPWGSRDDVLDRDWPAPLQEGPQDELRQRLLTSRPASGLALERLEGL